MKKSILLFIVISILALSSLAIAGSDFKIQINNPKDGSVVTQDYVWLDVTTGVNAVCMYSRGGCSFPGGCGASRPERMEETGKTHHIQLIEKLEETINNKHRQAHYFLDVKCTDKFGNQARARTRFTVDFPD